MGLTLHYSGRLYDPRDMWDLTNEVADICESLDWEYIIYDEIIDVPARAVPREHLAGDPKLVQIHGIDFRPPECETVSLACTNSGRLSSRFSLLMAPEFPDPDYVYYLHVKTQFAGPDLHIALVKLLKYLEKKYFTDFEVFDEGYYWDKEERELLFRRFAEYDFLIDAFSTALEQAPRRPEEHPLQWVERIEAVLRKRLEGPK